MTRTNHRKYAFSAQDVREALCLLLGSKGEPVPPYVGNAGTTKWVHGQSGDATVEWTEVEEVEKVE
jgi:hypothetical protein